MNSANTMSDFVYLIIVLVSIGPSQPAGVETLGSVDTISAEVIGPPYGDFERLDLSNALNSEYADFNWNGWKLAAAFVNPPITKDSLKVQNRIFEDLSPKRSFFSFLTEEIANTLRTRTRFARIEWQSIPLKAGTDTLVRRQEEYIVALPDSARETFWRTGCRFALLLQHFSPSISVYGPKSVPLMYQNVAPEATKLENYRNTRMFYSVSFTYVLYDLMDDRVAQFGKAFDDGKSERTSAEDISHCLEDAVFDVIQVSRFYKR
jgi:hypothetical protein